MPVWDANDKTCAPGGAATTQRTPNRELRPEANDTPEIWLPPILVLVYGSRMVLTFPAFDSTSCETDKIGTFRQITGPDAHRTAAWQDFFASESSASWADRKLI